MSTPFASAAASVLHHYSSLFMRAQVPPPDAGMRERIALLEDRVAALERTRLRPFVFLAAGTLGGALAGWLMRWLTG
jgi:hypothetical protein